MPRICLTIQGSTPQPYRFPLDTELVTIGRAEDNDVLVVDGSVSSHHCEMKRVPGGFDLIDSQSTNGILLDEVEQEVIELENGLNIQVGDVTFEYLLSEEELEELATEKRKSPKKKKKNKEKAVPAKKSAPAAVSSPPPVVTNLSKNSSSRDFAIFSVCALLALYAFYLGLNSAHRASFPKDERHGKSIWSDKIIGSEEDA